MYLLRCEGSRWYTTTGIAHGAVPRRWVRVVQDKLKLDIRELLKQLRKAEAQHKILQQAVQDVETQQKAWASMVQDQKQLAVMHRQKTQQYDNDLTKLDRQLDKDHFRDEVSKQGHQDVQYQLGHLQSAAIVDRCKRRLGCISSVHCVNVVLAVTGTAYQVLANLLSWRYMPGARRLPMPSLLRSLRRLQDSRRCWLRGVQKWPAIMICQHLCRVRSRC